MEEVKEVREAKERTGVPKGMWIAIWAVATFVTLIGGNPNAANWKPEVQFPGSFMVAYFEWVIGPFGVLMTPLVFRVLTILTNVLAYYGLAKIFLFSGES